MSGLALKKLNSVHNYYKDNGFVRTCKYIITNLFKYDKYIVFERNPDEPIAQASPKIPISIRKLCNTDGDIEKVVEFWPDFYASAKGGFPSIREMVATDYVMEMNVLWQSLMDK